ncbi:MATE family efflux transporter [Planctomycetota bacterium]
MAVPVVFTQLSMMGMGIVDTLMVGRLGEVALGAVSIGNTIYFTIAIVLMGCVMGTEPVIGRAEGAGRRAECGRALWQGLWLAAAFGAPVTLLLRDAAWLAELLGQRPEIVEGSAAYLAGRAYAITPFLLFAAQRYFLNAVGNTRAVMVVALAANVLNVIADYALIFGKLGFPALGVQGAGYATSVSMLGMAVLAGVMVFGGAYRTYGVRPRFPSWTRIREVLRLGIPLGMQLGAEMGVFAVAAVMAGWLGKTPLAAHQVALTLASVTYMVPLGVSVAASVRVSQCLGAKDPAAAERAGKITLGLGAAFMSLAAIVFLTMPTLLVRLFTDEPGVIATGRTLICVAGLFQISDGLQVVAAGCLRGAADTKTPLLANLIGHWGVGLPLGYLLAFRCGLGVTGLWIALTTSLTIVGVVLAVRFLRGRWRQDTGPQGV